MGPLCGPPLRWWVLCGVLPSVWVPCGWGSPPVMFLFAVASVPLLASRSCSRSRCCSFLCRRCLQDVGARAPVAPRLSSEQRAGLREALRAVATVAGGVWPPQDNLLLQVVCARINRPSIPPAHLHCPHCCTAIARLLGYTRPPTRSTLCMPYTIEYW